MVLFVCFYNFFLGINCMYIVFTFFYSKLIPRILQWFLNTVVMSSPSVSMHGLEDKNKKRQSRKLSSEKQKTTCCTQDTFYLLTQALTHAIPKILEKSQPVASIS